MAKAETFETLRFLTPELCFEIADKFGSPCYAYDFETLKNKANEALAFPNAYGLTVRYAMKASPNAAILKLFDKKGLHFDCSSIYEIRRAMAAGVAPEKCSLSSQELTDGFEELVEKGVKVNCCSLMQVEKFCAKFPGKEVGLRFNPGLGSGGNGKTNVGGPWSSFGIWYEWADKAAEMVNAAGCKVVRIHTHIGSGSDPAVWRKTSGMSIALCEKFPDVHTLNLGGGYKVARMKTEKGTNLQTDCAVVKDVFEEFATKFGRKLHLEIEPGTFLSANCCSLVCLVHDVVTTGTNEGRTFIKLNAGMTELLRPSLYGSQHPQIVVPRTPTEETGSYVVVGHCCESGVYVCVCVCVCVCVLCEYIYICR
jgi:diaminopimelate decarboxylase